jgi:hypothetical protein
MRANDVRNAGGGAGEGIALPDIGAYGGSNPGVFGVCENPVYPGMPFSRGRAFYWGDDSPGLIRLIAARAAARTPYVLEPALASLADDWAVITSTAPAPGAPALVPEGAPDRDGAPAPRDSAPAAESAPAPVDPRYDLITTRTGRTAPGTAGVRAKLAQAASTEAAAIPPIPPGMEALAADVLAERRRHHLAAYADESADLPHPQAEALRAMLAAPAGVSIRVAADALGIGRDRVHRQLMRWRAQGTAVVPDGARGSNRRWHAISPGEAGVAYPPLQAVEDAGEGGS